MRKNIFIPVYSCLVTIIFILTIIISCVSLYNENSKGYIESKKTFDKMNLELKNVFESTDSSDMNEKISKAIGSYNNYSYITIKLNNETIFLYPGDKETPGENTKFSKLYFKSQKAGNANLYVAACVYTLSPATISFYAKTDFLIILIFTILTIMIIVYISLKEDKIKNLTDETKNNYNEESSIENEDETHTENNENSSEKQFDYKSVLENETLLESNNGLSDSSVLESVVLSEENISSFEEDSISQSETIQINNEKDEEENENINNQTEEYSLPVEDCKPSENIPNGLYSPLTGFGWESYFMPRLENELIRASSSEFDLCLFLIKINGLSKKSDIIKKISDILCGIFQFRDLIFEYKNDCFAAIKTNQTIDEAIPVADELYSEISNLLIEEKLPCFIGLSSKTIRLVSGERLLKEAEAALEHAQTDPESPIIAFRADAEKYMNFIEKN
ncbi:MAG: GGDEF domain-containing protein [Clostridia bacterium]|nr:GGDEF domain-containing protein [Clostridia bacterium]